MQGCRLSRAWRTIKNTFDILANRWRKLWQQIKADIETVQLIVQASICLHNFLQLTFSTFYNPSRFFDTELSDGSVEEGNWRRIVQTDAGGLGNGEIP